jgi:hypothetical protein
MQVLGIVIKIAFDDVQTTTELQTTCTPKDGSTALLYASTSQYLFLGVQHQQASFQAKDLSRVQIPTQG